MNSSHSSPVSIALVDDDLVDRMLTIRAFREAGLTNPIVELPDGEALLDLLARRGAFETSERPGLVLLDLTMPRLDGRSTLERLRAMPDMAELPVVVLTQSELPDDIRRSYLAGATSYIAKPVDFDGIVRVVKAIPSLGIALVTRPAS
ncbi:MAG: response regulator [Myxococcales bacterium]|nr:response regulator [Myxococcales bacterium]MCB9520508.1 response regulator [Myxococcales bacterium]